MKLKDFLNKQENRYIKKYLIEYNYNIRVMSKEIGIGTKRLYLLIKKHKIILPSNKKAKEAILEKKIYNLKNIIDDFILQEYGLLDDIYKRHSDNKRIPRKYFHVKNIAHYLFFINEIPIRKIKEITGYSSVNTIHENIRNLKSEISVNKVVREEIKEAVVKINKMIENNKKNNY